MKHPGKGSTVLLFDLYLDEESDHSLALNPTLLHRKLKVCIEKVGMKRRKDLLDEWKSPTEGPMSSFISIEESHLRVETWPDELHLNGDVQLCNFSRDNSGIAADLCLSVIREINPKHAYVLTCVRGPGPALTPTVKKILTRGKPLVIEQFHVKTVTGR